MFLVTTEPLQPFDMGDPRAGGYATFEGRVRDLNEGRSVTALVYEAFESMAVSEGEAVLSEARSRFAILDARCAHRLGRLEVGDLAIVVSVAAAHRSEAFDACRFIVDEGKHRLPIWKKEFYADGESAWVNCRCGEQSHPDRSQEERRGLTGVADCLEISADAGRTPRLGSSTAPELTASDYSRQTALPEIGPVGQRKLAGARVLVVGAGGLGCPALQYLAAAGVGTIGISDGDVVDRSNLHRQVLFGPLDVGKSKAHAAAEAVRRLNPAADVRVHGPIASASRDVVGDYDLILDCTDSFAAKFLMSDLAVEQRKILVQASIYRFEGQVWSYVPGESACLRCLWPETPPPGCLGTCAEVGVMGFTAGHFGVLQAVEATKLIVGFGETLSRHVLTVDLLDYSARRIRREANPDCPCCGAGAKRRASQMPLTDMAAYTLTPSEALACDLPIVDIREHSEEPMPHAAIVGRWRHIPMSALGSRLEELEPGCKYVLMCAHGVRSDRVVRQLRAAGDVRFYSLEGGDAELRKVAGG